MGKTYVTDITLGARSATDDGEGPITPVAVESPPSRAELNAALMSFRGTVQQVPPAFSAVKVSGRRSYALARQSRNVQLPPRAVRIDALAILAYDFPSLRLEVHCGKGTYIRSLARDLGEKLGCAGYVSSLRRTSLGHFRAEQAVPLETDAETARTRLLPLAAAVIGLSHVALDTVGRLGFCNGKAVPCATPIG